MKRFLPVLLTLAAIILLPLAALVSCQGSLIFHPDAEEVAPNFADTQAVRIETEDGESLVAWYRAPNPDQPIFLFFDGNGGRPQIWGGRWRRIAESGAGFLAVYYRGYSGSTGHPTERGLHVDGRAGYEWLIDHGYQPNDIVIHGFSLGSGVAVRVAAEHPARALILEAPFTGIDDVVSDKFSPLAALLVRESFRSRDIIHDVAMPVLIVHGDRDSVVPFSQGQRLFDLANEPKQFVRMSGSDHATLVRDGIYPYIYAFLDAHPAE